MLAQPRAWIIAFVSSAVIGSAVTYAAYQAETSSIKARATEQLASAISLINDGISRDIAYLNATRSFISAYPGALRRTPFARYVENLNISGPEVGLQGMGFALVLDPNTIVQTENQLFEDYNHRIGAWPKSDILPTTAIILLEPSDARNMAAMGFDMYSEPRRRAAMDLSAQTKEAAMTVPLILLQEITGNPQPGVLIYSHMPAQSEGDIEGYVYSPVRLGDLFEKSFERVSLTFRLKVTDRDAPELPLFTSPGFVNQGKTPDARLFLHVAGRSWMFDAQFDRSHDLTARYPFSIITGIAMILLTFVTTFAVQAQAAATQRAKDLSDAQSQLMREKDLHLREMSHRMKNSLTRVVAMARQAARGSATKDEFVQSINGRLRAMANAQDMLTRSARGETDLHALLASELSQIGTQSDDFATLDGPKVELDARETQALGLSFHELATNALKYGAGAVEGAKLVIHWEVETRAHGAIFLTLVWDEQTGMATKPPSHKGFGNQLLDSCIRLELRGSITRKYHDQGLTVTIHVPLSPYDRLATV